MDKQYLMNFVGVLAIGVLAYSVYATRSDIDEAKNNFNQLTLQASKQGAIVTENGEMTRQLLDKITELQQSLISSASSNNPTQKQSQETTLKLTNMSKKVNSLTQQLSALKEGLKKVESNSTGNLPRSVQIEDPVQDFQMQIQARNEQKRIEVEQMESTYEVALSEGDEDIALTNNLQAKISAYFTEKGINETTQLKNIECNSNLCKVIISQSEESAFDDESLLPQLGDVSVYINKVDSAIQGQQDYVMYISKEGSDLPPVNRNNDVVQ